MYETYNLSEIVETVVVSWYKRLQYQQLYYLTSIKHDKELYFDWIKNLIGLNSYLQS